jgi:hypothetical protein
LSLRVTTYIQGQSLKVVVVSARTQTETAQKNKREELADFFCFPLFYSVQYPIFGRFRKKRVLTTTAAVDSTTMIPMDKPSGTVLFSVSVAAPLFPCV